MSRITINRKFSKQSCRSTLQIIRSVLKNRKHEQGRNLPQLDFKFQDLWSIGIFTADDIFCSQFQKDTRMKTCGCKWTRFWAAFTHGLKYLAFVQNLGSGSKVGYV